MVYCTSAALPTQPLRLSSKGKLSSTTVRLSWGNVSLLECCRCYSLPLLYNATLVSDPPGDDGGSVVQSYCVQLDSGSGFTSAYGGVACECSCLGLLPGYTYRARVAAVNAVGQGRWSDCLQLTTKPIPPSQCVKPSLVGKPKSHSMQIKWGGPTADGGSPVNEYVVKLIYMDDTSRECYRGPSLECVVAGLSPGHSYLLQVRV